MADDMLPAEERDALAAELALGVLEGEDLASALRLQLSDSAFAAAVEDWRLRFGPMFEELDPVMPSDASWSAIAARLPVPSEGVAPLPLESGLQRRLQRWRAGTFTMGAIAASLALLLVTRVPEPVVPSQPVQVGLKPTIIAQMKGEPEGPLLVARYDPETMTLTVRAERIEPGALVPELWIIPSDGTPRSLGFIQRDGKTTVTVAAEYRTLLQDGATLAVTMEQPSATPHKAPGSAPVAAGTISTI